MLGAPGSPIIQFSLRQAQLLQDMLGVAIKILSFGIGLHTATIALEQFNAQLILQTLGDYLTTLHTGENPESPGENSAIRQNCVKYGGIFDRNSHFLPCKIDNIIIYSLQITCCPIPVLMDNQWETIRETYY